MTNLFLPTGVRPAIVTVDLHRGHLDPNIATMPLPAVAAARVVETNVAFLNAARGDGLPIVHVVTTYRNLDEVHSNPFWKALDGTSFNRGNMREHNFFGTLGTQLMPGVEGAGDVVVRTKKRYDSFLSTDLDFVLRQHNANTLLISGVNTNSCVLATTIVAQTRDYAPIVVSDCVHTIDGDHYHRMALDIIERAFGWVMPWRVALRTVRDAAMGEAAPSVGHSAPAI